MFLIESGSKNIAADCFFIARHSFSTGGGCFYLDGG